MGKNAESNPIVRTMVSVYGLNLALIINFFIFVGMCSIFYLKKEQKIMEISIILMIGVCLINLVNLLITFI